METYYSPTEGSLETRLLYGCSLQFLLELGWFVSQGGNLSSAYTPEPPGKLKTKHVDFPALPQKFQLLVTGLGSQWSTAGAGGEEGVAESAGARRQPRQPRWVCLGPGVGRYSCKQNPLVPQKIAL